MKRGAQGGTFPDVEPPESTADQLSMFAGLRIRALFDARFELVFKLICARGET
jgi:hypothetical protein